MTSGNMDLSSLRLDLSRIGSTVADESRKASRISTARAIVANTFSTPEELRSRHTQGLTARRRERERLSKTGEFGFTSRKTPRSPRSQHVWSKWHILKLEEAGRNARRNSAAALGFSSENDGIDFAFVGGRIGSRLREIEDQSKQYSKSHLDVVFALKLVERVWLKACEMGDGLDENQFTDFLSSILSMDKSHLNTLFQKMDANSDGTLTWDEYLSYLLKEVTHNWKYSMAKGTWHIRETDAIPCDARTPIRQILCIPGDPVANSPSKYVLSGADQSVQVWNADTMNFQCLLPLNVDAIKAKSRAHMKKSETIVRNVHSRMLPMSRESRRSASPRNQSSLSNKTGGRSSQLTVNAARKMDRNQIRELAEYLTPEHISSATSANLPFSIKIKENCMPHSCLAYYARQRQIAVAGLDRSISFYSSNFKDYVLQDSFYSANIPQCMSIDPVGNLDYCFLGDTIGNISMYNAMTKKHISTVHIHGKESVRRTILVPGLGLISAGMDARIAITDIDKSEVVRYLHGHQRGIYSLAYSSSYRCLLSAGFDSNVYVWDPYYSKPIGKLHAQHSNIVDVLINEPKNQILTVSADKKIKIFDIRNFRCIQSCVDSTHHSPVDALSAAFFDKEKQQLVVAGSKMRIWPVQIAPGNKSIRGGTAHLNLVVKVCYSPVFKQLITIGVDETVRLWDIESGKCAFTFNTTHYAPISSACLDHRSKRFISAASDGSVKMWNFNNGACMHEYQALQVADLKQKEVTQLIHLPQTQSSVAAVIDGIIGRLPEPPTKANSFVVQKKAGSEILCMSSAKNVVVSGSSTGEIYVWSVESCHLVSSIHLPKPTHDIYGDSTDSTHILSSPHNPVSKITCFVKDGQVHALIGMDDGSFHVVNIRKSMVLLSVYHIFTDSIAGIALSEDQTRLFIADTSSKAKLFDFSALHLAGTSTIAADELVLINEWTPHKAGIVTDLIFVDDCKCFVTSSDNGEVVLWSMDGAHVADLGSRKPWPLVEQADGSIVVSHDIPRNASFSSMATLDLLQEDERRHAAGQGENGKTFITESNAEGNSGNGHDDNSNGNSDGTARIQKSNSLRKTTVPVEYYAKGRPRYEDLHPPYKPRTLSKHGLRTANFNLTPLSTANERKPKEDLKNSRMNTLLQRKLKHLEETLQKQYEEKNGNKKKKTPRKRETAQYTRRTSLLAQRKPNPKSG